MKFQRAELLATHGARVVRVRADEPAVEEVDEPAGPKLPRPGIDEQSHTRMRGYVRTSGMYFTVLAEVHVYVSKSL